MTNYYIIPVIYEKQKIPVLIDANDVEFIMSLNKEWKCSENGNIYCHCANKKIYLHDIIMSRKILDNKNLVKQNNTQIIHINRIGLDNRRDNLEYKIKVRTRYAKLPPDCGINVNDIPQHVCYMKGDDTHGERFIVELNDKFWKTTSSKKVSLKYKLEEAKKYLSENDKQKKLALELVKSFYDIIYKFGYDHIEQLPYENVKLDKRERNILNNLKISNNEKEPIKRRRLINKIPLMPTINITSNNLPTYCYYVPQNDKHGDYFVIDGHKNLDSVWYTTTSKKISTEEKYKELMNKYLLIAKKTQQNNIISLI